MLRHGSPCCACHSCSLGPACYLVSPASHYDGPFHWPLCVDPGRPSYPWPCLLSPARMGAKLCQQEHRGYLRWEANLCSTAHASCPALSMEPWPRCFCSRGRLPLCPADPCRVIACRPAPAHTATPRQAPATAPAAWHPARARCLVVLARSAIGLHHFWQAPGAFCPWSLFFAFCGCHLLYDAWGTCCPLMSHVGGASVLDARQQQTNHVVPETLAVCHLGR